jgi:hypothetical protein
MAEVGGEAVEGVAGIRELLEGLEGATADAERSRGRVEFTFEEMRGVVTPADGSHGGHGVARVELAVGDAAASSPWTSRWVSNSTDVWDPCRLVSTRRRNGTDELRVVTDLQASTSLDGLRSAVAATITAARRVRFVIAHQPAIDEWGQFADGFDDMVVTLAHADLPPPPVPPSLRPAIVRLDQWCWSTYEVQPWHLYPGLGASDEYVDSNADMTLRNEAVPIEHLSLPM